MKPATTPDTASQRTPAVSVRVLLFSVLREKVGADTLHVNLPAGEASGAGLLDHLSRQHPEIAPYRPVIRLAVNQVYARNDVALCAGDEVALITPVSGG